MEAKWLYAAPLFATPAMVAIAARAALDINLRRGRPSLTDVDVLRQIDLDECSEGQDLKRVRFTRATVYPQARERLVFGVASHDLGYCVGTLVTWGEKTLRKSRNTRISDVLMGDTMHLTVEINTIMDEGV